MCSVKNEKICSNYTILKQIGNEKKRKFSKLFLIENKFTREKFTLKIINTKTEDYILEAFRTEGKLKFNCSNIQSTLEFVETSSELMLIKKFIDGFTLDVFFNSIPKKKQINFIIEFLKKLEPIFDELKNKNLIHNDIKPSNFIIHGDLNDFEVYLIDFGLSFNTNYKISRKTLFSLGFSSPEIVLNKLLLANQSSDIYSLGITIYFLLCKRLPGHHANPAVMTNLQLTYPLEKTNFIPTDLFQIIEKMCAKGRFNKPPNILTDIEVERILIEGRNKRYQSLSEIISDLNNIKIKETSFLKKLIKIFSISKIEVKK